MNLIEKFQKLKVGDTRVVVGLGEDSGTGEIPEKINPNIEGLTTGTASYDGIFILRNPENCNLINYSLKEIPVYMEKKMKVNYETCMDFFELEKKDKINELIEATPNQIKDLEVISFIIDPSNFNTHIIRFKDKARKNFSSMWRFQKL